ncbi:MAG: ATP-dependent DNA helicase RecG, partial [Lachnospiraceae bacterium]|nr:ATP-dependent DNA helicase RecG [Lachnospiraceae bacterium]
GTVREYKGTCFIDHPEIMDEVKYRELVGRPVPVYGLTKGLSGKTVAKAVMEVMKEELPIFREFLPEEAARFKDGGREALCGEKEALRGIHFPKNTAELLRARERLIFDEFFIFILSVRMLRNRCGGSEAGCRMEVTGEAARAIDKLPYDLTAAQSRVWGEIERDMSGTSPMSRLVQGDVGSGKTAVAFLAMIMAASNGYQAALMAPTDVLAKQHFEKLSGLLKSMGEDPSRAVLLTGSVRGRERREALKRLDEGTAAYAVGTHALFQSGVAYRRLGLVIADEQHRFGVRQRQALGEKGKAPHFIIMSATPIPRTLSAIYYADLDISVIDEKPASRSGIKTAVVDLTWKDKAVEFIAKRTAEGRQAYVICPMIEPNEELEAANVADEASMLKKKLPERRIGVLHGRMKPEKKNEVMEEFAAGNIDILVSTTVVEVGVDVPNATVMLVENAERFGLAQLHQLRGRVGRGEHQSYCIFMSGIRADEAAGRLEVLRDSDDGFVIAQKDLELRGPGDILGIRQSGDPQFLLADVTRDADIMKAAGEMAAAILEADPELESPENSVLLAKVRDVTAGTVPV